MVATDVIVTAMIFTAMTFTEMTFTAMTVTAMTAISVIAMTVTAMSVTAMSVTAMTVTAMTVTAMIVTAKIVTPMTDCHSNDCQLSFSGKSRTKASFSHIFTSSTFSFWRKSRMKALLSHLQHSLFEGSHARNASLRDSGCTKRCVLQLRWMEKGLPHGRVVEEMREDERTLVQMKWDEMRWGQIKMRKHLTLRRDGSGMKSREIVAAKHKRLCRTL